MRIQETTCGATQSITYCLKLPRASLIVLFTFGIVAGCSLEESPATTPGEARAATKQPSHGSSDPEYAASGDTNGERASTPQVTPRPATKTNAERPVVVFLGTSLTAGYGLREDQAFPALIQTRIDAAGFEYRVVNAGVSGDTSAGGLRRVDWLLRLPVAVLVLELGANDMLRGLSIESLRENLGLILTQTKTRHPDVRILIAGMRAAPNLGSDYRDVFDRIYPDLAKEHMTAIIPFLLDGIAAKPALNQVDGIHPTAEGHQLIAKRVWDLLEPILRSN